MKLHIERRVFLGFIVTGSVLVVLGVWSYVSTQRLIDTAQLSAHATRIIFNAEQVMKGMVDIETGQRGYVITGQEDFLEPYYESSQRIGKYLNTLDSLTTGNPDQQHRVDALRANIQIKLAWSKSVINARRENFEKARDFVASAQGKQTTDSIREIVKNIQQEERVLFQQRNTVSGASLRQFQYSFMGLVIASTVIIVYLFYVINRMMKAKNEAEEKLRQTLDETRDLYDNAPCGYLSVGSDITLSNMNQTLLNWLGYQHDEVIGKMKYDDLLTPESKIAFQSGFKQDFEKYKTEGFVNDLEFDFQRKDGTKFPVIVNSIAVFNAAGEFVKSRSTVMDNTVQKRIKARFIELLEAAPDATVIVDHEGIIQMINKQCKTIFGYKQDELVGQKVEMLMPARYRDVHPKHRSNFFAGPSVRQMGEGIELLGLKKDGNEFPVEISLSPIETEEGSLVSASIRDITERKFNENTILKLNQELEAFTYSVSHDLRAPLRSITGYAQILKEDSGDKLDDEGNRVLHVIMNNANRMGQLIDDLLDFSRLGRKELNRVIVNMDQLVRDVVDELTAHENERQLNISVQPLVPVKGDSSMLRQVWVNLISNALKYSSQREITEIEIGYRVENGRTCYYISDNGAGFDMRYVDKLFGVFQRLHKINEFEGTGVGLALVKTIISRHGGRVWAEGKVNEGAKFYFELPSE